jgi:hypothetical protein
VYVHGTADAKMHMYSPCRTRRAACSGVRRIAASVAPLKPSRMSEHFLSIWKSLPQIAPDMKHFRPCHRQQNTAFCRIPDSH